MNVLVLEDAKYRQKEFRSNIPCAVIVDTAEACIAELQKATEPWDWVFLDHDLGEEIYVDTAEKNTGSEVVRWIRANKPEIKNIIVHSLNHSAAHYMAMDLLGAEYEAKAIPFHALKEKIFEAIQNGNGE